MEARFNDEISKKYNLGFGVADEGIVLPFSEKATQPVCSLNKYGYCKFRNNCRKML